MYKYTNKQIHTRERAGARATDAPRCAYGAIQKRIQKYGSDQCTRARARQEVTEVLCLEAVY